jgi:F0F1-type ATP synthase epsilon subunit
MKLNIFTPKSKKTYGDLVSITIPTQKGVMEVLTNHAETFARLTKGTIILKSEASIKKEEIQSDTICYIKDNSITVIV